MGDCSSVREGLLLVSGEQKGYWSVNKHVFSTFCMQRPVEALEGEGRWKRAFHVHPDPGRY